MFSNGLWAMAQAVGQSRLERQVWEEVREQEGTLCGSQLKYLAHCINKEHSQFLNSSFITRNTEMLHWDVTFWTAPGLLSKVLTLGTQAWHKQGFWFSSLLPYFCWIRPRVSLLLPKLGSTASAGWKVRGMQSSWGQLKVMSLLSLLHNDHGIFI